MEDEMYDLVVMVINKIALIREEKEEEKRNDNQATKLKGHHVISAFKNGVLTGLGLGKVAFKAEMDRDYDLLEVLHDMDLDLSDLLKRANGFMPEGKRFEAEMFRKSDYRDDEVESEYYAEGIDLGYNYVFDLFGAMHGLSTAVMAERSTLDHLKTVVSSIEQM